MIQSLEKSRKIWILTKGIFNDSESDLLRIMKMTYVKILLEQLVLTEGI